MTAIRPSHLAAAISLTVALTACMGAGDLPALPDAAAAPTFCEASALGVSPSDPDAPWTFPDTLRLGGATQVRTFERSPHPAFATAQPWFLGAGSGYARFRFRFREGTFDRWGLLRAFDVDGSAPVRGTLVRTGTRDGVPVYTGPDMAESSRPAFVWVPAAPPCVLQMYAEALAVQ